jgi:hypothetical protein
MNGTIFFILIAMTLSSQTSFAAHFVKKCIAKINTYAKSESRSREAQEEKKTWQPEEPYYRSIIIVGTKKNTSELLKSAFSDQEEKDAWHSTELAIEEEDFDGTGLTIHYLLSPFRGAILTVDINESAPFEMAKTWCYNDNLHHFDIILAACNCDRVYETIEVLTLLHEHVKDEGFWGILPKELVYNIMNIYIKIYRHDDIFKKIEALEAYAQEIKIPFMITSSKHNFQTALLFSQLRSVMKY